MELFVNDECVTKRKGARSCEPRPPDMTEIQAIQKKEDGVFAVLLKNSVSFENLIRVP
jgi:hypothetical protein